MLDKLKKFIVANKKNSGIAAALIALLIFICVLLIRYNVDVPTMHYSSDKFDTTTGPIWSGTEIKQTFSSEENGLNAISLRFGTYMSSCDGNISISIHDVTGAESVKLYSETFKASTLADNQFKSISFPAQRAGGERIFELTVTATDVSEHPATLWCSSDSDIGSLKVNGEELNADLNIKLYHATGFGVNDIITIVFFMIMIGFVILALRYKVFPFNEAKHFKYLKQITLILLAVFFIASVKCESDGLQLFYSINFIGLALFAVLLILTIVFEKRLRLYSSAKAYILNEYREIKEKGSEIKDAPARVKLLSVTDISLRIISKVSAIAFVLSVVVFLAFNYISAASVLTGFILSIVSIAATLLHKTAFEKNTDVAKLFLFIALISAIFLSYSLPPITDYMWDAEIHYARTLDLKNALLFNTYSEFDAYQEIKLAHLTRDYIQNIDTVIADYTKLFNTPATNSYLAFNIYNHLGYMPVALALTIAEILGMSFLATMSLSKFTNAVIYIALIFAGIKKIKSGKYFYAALAMMPTAMFLATGFNYDFWVTSFIAYSIACFISELQNQDKIIEAKTIFLMLATMFLGCGPKAIYFVLIIPMLFLPKSKFMDHRQRKKYFAASITAIGVIFLSFALPFLVNVEGASDLRGGSDVNSAEQIKFILTQPFKYLTIFFNFVSDYLSMASMNKNITYFSLLGEVGDIFGTVAIILIIFATFADRDNDLYIGRKRICAVGLLTAIVQFGLIATALYVAFTPVASQTINGVQFRYTYPVMFLLMHILGSGRVKISTNKRLMSFVILALLSANLYASLYDSYFDRIFALL